MGSPFSVDLSSSRDSDIRVQTAELKGLAIVKTENVQLFERGHGTIQLIGIYFDVAGLEREDLEMAEMRKGGQGAASAICDDEEVAQPAKGRDASEVELRAGADHQPSYGVVFACEPLETSATDQRHTLE